MTVVPDAGQNSGASFARLAGTRLRYAGSVPGADAGPQAVPAAGGRLAADRRPQLL